MVHKSGSEISALSAMIKARKLNKKFNEKERLYGLDTYDELKKDSK